MNGQTITNRTSSPAKSKTSVIVLVPPESTVIVLGSEVEEGVSLGAKEFVTLKDWISSERKEKKPANRWFFFRWSSCLRDHLRILLQHSGEDCIDINATGFFNLLSSKKEHYNSKN